jgi:hypothetical protein
MPEYVNTNPGEVLGLHDVLRVTFTATPHWFEADAIVRAAFSNEIANMIAAMESGGFPVAPVSDITITPGTMATTIDFMPVSDGVTVSSALSRLSDALASGQPWANTAVSRVRKIAAKDSYTGGTARGLDTTAADAAAVQAAAAASPWSFLGNATLVVGLLAGVGLLFFYGPEIKAGLKGIRGRKSN